MSKKIDKELDEVEVEETEEESKASKKDKNAKSKETLTLDFEMDPIERLTKEIEFTGSEYKKIVGNFLLKEFSKDINLANDYKERKITLDKVWSSIISAARSKSENNGCVAMSDEEVFGLAIHFVHDGKIPDTKSDSYTLSKEEKESLEEKAKKEYLAEQKKKLEEAEKKRLEKEETARKKALEKQKKEREESGQMSIFDFGDEQ